MIRADPTTELVSLPEPVRGYVRTYAHLIHFDGAQQHSLTLRWRRTRTTAGQALWVAAGAILTPVALALDAALSPIEIALGVTFLLSGYDP